MITPPPDQEPDRPDPTSVEGGMARLRHDLKNQLTALRSGCELIDRCLTNQDLVGAGDILDKMRAEIVNGFATVNQLSAWEEPSAGSPD